MATKGTNTAAKQRLIQEIGILLVVVLAIGGFSYYNYAQSKPVTPEHVVTPLDTSFDTAALKRVKTTDTTNPDVTPAQSELGKSDPFAP